MHYSWVQIILVSLWAAYCIIDLKSLKFMLATRPLIAGFGAGIILGDMKLGLLVGGTMELMSMGIWNYGGAPIPDYTAGTIIGVSIGHATGLGITPAVAAAVPIALLFTYFDVLAMTINTFLQHNSDKKIEAGDVVGLERVHKLGYFVWGLSRALPVFLGVMYGPSIVATIFKYVPQNILDGLKVAGGLLPALGMAMLLKMLPIKKYWAFLIVGYVCLAYLKLNLIGIALVGVSFLAIFTYMRKNTPGTSTVATKAVSHDDLDDL